MLEVDYYLIIWFLLRKTKIHIWITVIRPTVFMGVSLWFWCGRARNAPWYSGQTRKVLVLPSFEKDDIFIFWPLLLALSMRYDDSIMLRLKSLCQISPKIRGYDITSARNRVEDRSEIYRALFGDAKRNWNLFWF